MIWFILGILSLIIGLGCAIFMEDGKGFSATVGIVAAIIFTIVSVVSVVPTGYTGIVTTFGTVHNETLSAGLNVHAPWDNVITMDNREQRATFQLEAFSKDIQQVDIQGSINLNIDKSTAMILYKDVGTDYINVLVQPRIEEDVKTVIAKYTAESLIDSRQQAADQIYQKIKEELSSKGINIISLAMENIDFTDAFEKAVEDKQVATQEKQKAQTEQERMTMEEEAKAKRAVIVANAEAEKAKIAAQADLEVVKIQSEASLYAGQREAEMNQRIAETLTEDLIKYYEIKQWDGKLPTFIGGEGTMPILDFGGVE